MQQELSRDGGTLRKLLAPVPVQRISASLEDERAVASASALAASGELSAASGEPPYESVVPAAAVPSTNVPSADVLTADMPTAELTALQRSAPSAHIGFAIAQAAACTPWSGYVPSLPHASYIEAKDTLRQLAYRCAYCWRATSCRMAVTRVRCQRVAASRDAGLYAQWAQGSRVRDLCIQPVWHMRRTMAWAPGGFNPPTYLVRHTDSSDSGVDGTVRPLPCHPRDSPNRPRCPPASVLTLGSGRKFRVTTCSAHSAGLGHMLAMVEGSQFRREG